MSSTFIDDLAKPIEALVRETNALAERREVLQSLKEAGTMDVPDGLLEAVDNRVAVLRSIQAIALTAEKPTTRH
jgi:hypothetical protein